MNTHKQTRSTELQSRINKALSLCNELIARELGKRPLRHKPKRVTRARAMPDSPKLRDVKKYRREHPNCSLREAATAAGFFK